MTKRSFIAFIVVVASWYWMQIIHEFGHVLGAVATGGTVRRVVLEYMSFSRTDVEPNPRPLVVVWAGPIVGVTIPLLMWLVIRFTVRKGSVIFGILAGFCLIANGAYIGVGSLDAVGDAGHMMQHGTPDWVLWAFGTVAAGTGLWVWHVVHRNQAGDRGPSDMAAFALMSAALLLFTIV